MLLVFLLLAIANLDILQNKRLENAQQVGRTLARSYAVEEGRSVSILAVTANAFAEDIAATTEVGMNAHISKPIAFGILWWNRCAERALKKADPMLERLELGGVQTQTGGETGRANGMGRAQPGILAERRCPIG